jgi:ferritin heavy chain
MTTAEGAKKIIAEVSNHDLDQWVRTASFTSEIEEVWVFRTAFGIHVQK